MTQPTEPPVFVVAHDLRGDFNNALAVAHAIARAQGRRVQVLNARLRMNAFLPLLRWALSSPRRIYSLWPLLFRGKRPRPGSVQAVVGTLGRGEPVVAAAGVLLGVPAIQIGAPKRLHPRYFSAVIAHQGTEAAPTEIFLPLPPTRVTPAEARQEARSLRIPAAQGFALLMIGGPTHNIRYNTTFWESIYNFLQKEGRKKRWLINTSQRTPTDIMQRLGRLARDSSHIEDIDLYDGQGCSRLLRYLGLASTALVTGESLSMIADALGAGLRVGALISPATKQDTKIDRLLSLWEERNLLRRVHLEEHTGSFPELPAAEARPYWSDAFWTELRARSVTI